MPERLKRELEAGARAHHFVPGGKRWDAYVYGAKPMIAARRREQAEKRRRKRAKRRH